LTRPIPTGNGEPPSPAAIADFLAPSATGVVAERFSAAALDRARESGISTLRPLTIGEPRAEALRQVALEGGLFGLRDAAGTLLALAALEIHRPGSDPGVTNHDETAFLVDVLLESGSGVGESSGLQLLALLERAATGVGAGLLRTRLPADDRMLARRWQPRGYLPLEETATPAGPALMHEKRLRPLSVEGLAVSFLETMPESFPGAVRATLLFVVRGRRILLIHKNRGHGAGNINGPGGKLDPGETPRQCAVREVEEELRIRVTPPRFVGELLFQETDGSRIHGYVFRSGGYRGTPTETDEAIPHWCDVDAIPWHRMWRDDRLWLPWLLEGEQFRAAFLCHGARIEQALFEPGPQPEPD
jgi:8-oxo-dGTP diphosphatase